MLSPVYHEPCSGTSSVTPDCSLSRVVWLSIRSLGLARQVDAGDRPFAVLRALVLDGVESEFDSCRSRNLTQLVEERVGRHRQCTGHVVLAGAVAGVVAQGASRVERSHQVPGNRRS